LLVVVTSVESYNGTLHDFYIARITAIIDRIIDRTDIDCRFIFVIRVINLHRIAWLPAKIRKDVVRIRDFCLLNSGCTGSQLMQHQVFRRDFFSAIMTGY
jgi:hypothetical protein